jgi:hypothetical protein
MLRRGWTHTGAEDFSVSPALQEFAQKSDSHVDKDTEAQEELQAPWGFLL